jgi:glycosyltransferase involved in cell wall biosynthesis
MKVSVIIPTYNEEKVIKDCLESLFLQSYKDMEIIVIDDGSKDNTLNILSEMKSSTKINVLKQAHKGPGMARNLGALSAKGEILVFIDADMTFDEGFIKDLVKPIIDSKSKGTFSKNEIVSNFENVWSRCWNINQNWENKKRLPKNYPDTQKVFRAILKSEFDKVGGFSKGGFYTDDWTLSEKLGYEAEAVAGAKYYHQNPDNLEEVFSQSKWSSKRSYKLGVLGYLIALIRATLPVSVLIGVIKSVKHKNMSFLVFKIIYDLGTFIGVTSYMLSGKGAK